jgi:phenylpyruvate tautomerase PptA (4-oxalocrotonate tautomerase family)
MPRWTVHSLEGAITREQKDSIAEQVTNLYTKMGIPAFWVNVFFHTHTLGGFYSGGKAQHNSVFFHIDHAARKWASEEERQMFLGSIDQIMRPVLGGCSKWEFNVYWHNSDNWRINGMIPPMDRPEILKQWMETDDAIPYER